MGSAEAQPSPLEQKYKLKNLGEKAPTCESGTRWRRGVEQRAQRGGSRNGGKGSWEGEERQKRSIKSWRRKENREEKE